MNNIAGSTGRCSSGQDDSYPAAADGSACSTTSIAWPSGKWDVTVALPGVCSRRIGVAAYRPTAGECVAH